MKFAPLLEEYGKKDPADDWPDDCDRFIGFIDIMGFKDLVARRAHKDIKHMLLQMNQTRSILLKMLAHSKVVLTGQKNEKEDLRVKSFTFSDSVVFITKSNTFLDLVNLAVAMTICQEASLQSGLPTKGAISFGNMTADFDRSIFFGQPLIDAYLLQDQLFYYGVVLDNHAETELKKFSEQNSERLEAARFVRLQTPLKNGKVNHYNLRLDSIEDDQLDYLYNSVSGAPRKYVDNTIEMYQEMQKSKSKGSATAE